MAGQQQWEMDAENGEGDQEDQNDEDWLTQDENENPKKRRRRSRRPDNGGGDGGGGDDDDGEYGKIPFEIISKTSGVAVRLGLSHDQHLVITTAILQCSGVDLNSYPLSHSTTVRRRKEVIEEVYEQSREEFRQQAVAIGAPVNVHPDTKQLQDTIGVGQPD